MPTLWRRRPALRTRRLLAAAYLGTASADSDLTACRNVAFRAARRDSTTLQEVLAVAEDMLLDEANYDVVVALLEDLQNVVSHNLEMFWTTEQVADRLGPKCAVVWASLNTFWTSVAAWCAETDQPAESADEILGATNTQLRILLWTSHRSQPNGTSLQIAHALLFEKAGRPPIPGFSHIAAALDSLGRT
jgi:hypothetical protein